MLVRRPTSRKLCSASWSVAILFKSRRFCFAGAILSKIENAKDIALVLVMAGTAHQRSSRLEPGAPPKACLARRWRACGERFCINEGAAGTPAKHSCWISQPGSVHSQVTSMSHPGHSQVTSRSHPGHGNNNKICTSSRGL